jgi:hypothetical protein
MVEQENFGNTCAVREILRNHSSYFHMFSHDMTIIFTNGIRFSQHIVGDSDKSDVSEIGQKTQFSQLLFY